MKDAPLSLAAEFPAASEKEWRALVDGTLKGASADRLTFKTYDGFSLQPLHGRDTDAVPLVHGRGESWQILQRIDFSDSGAANAQALMDLAEGARGLSLVTRSGIGARGFGLPVNAIGDVLAKVFIDAIPIEIDAGHDAYDVARALVAIVRSRKIEPEKTEIRFGLDPLGAAIVDGTLDAGWQKAFAEGIASLSSAGFAAPVATCDGRPVHDAGGSDAQELAFVAACAIAYLRALEQDGTPLDTARRMIAFRLSADADQFFTMAKFRALRKLWARIEQSCGLQPVPVCVSAETAWRMMTTRDIYVNILRGTIATGAAALGGADAITVTPFTQALGLPDAFARRIARNTQLILKDESNLARVTDPAAGSGSLETLTSDLCREAWRLFQTIEKAGGAGNALRSGVIQEQVAATRAAREAAFAKRRDIMIGTSDFPHLSEVSVDVLAPARRGTASAAKPDFAPLTPMRLSAHFEALRDASDETLRQTGARPRVFLSNLGKPADFIARSAFARNFFEAGGIEAVAFLPATPGDLAELIAAFKQSRAAIACLCSSDAVYGEQASRAARAMTQAGARHVYLAGRKDTAAVDDAVQTYIFAGCDALATLRAAHAILGIPQNA